MPLSPGQRLGAYEVLAPLGEGGMGEVYRGRDTRLDRDVAIKVLPAGVAQDEDRLRRFEQEARATSALNHPNILTIYDIGTHAGAPYIVAELLEGAELRGQLDDGPLPVTRAVDCAQQLATGLAAAHDKGIVHRDLKPENVFVTRDGRIKILDFGLAKLTLRQGSGQAGTSAGGGSSQPTTLNPLTMSGMVMGTVGYMSPEQVRGQEADHRSDIFSLGLILHEMLSGRRTFTGDSHVEVMHAVLKDEPAELSESNAKISPALEKIVRRCLEKKPERRFQSASDLGFALEALSSPSTSGASRAAEVPAVDTATMARRGGRRERLAWVVAGLAVLGMVAIGVAYVRRPAPEAQLMRLFITPSEKATTFDWPVISPDGRTLAFVATEDGKTQLWVRPLDSTSAKSLGEADHANAGAAPFWSPDSQSIAFIREGKIRKVALTGGAAEAIAGVANFRGGTWSQAGIILFSESYNEIKRVSANGGAVTTIIRAAPPQGQTGLRAPVFLPDGRYFLYYASLGADHAKDGAWLASVDGGDNRWLGSCDSAGFGVVSDPSDPDDDRFLFVRQDALLAQAIDLGRRQLRGEPVRLAESVNTNNNRHSKFSVARNGTLVLLEGRPNTQFAWFDRAGKRLETVGQAGHWLAYRLSPDGQRLVAERMEEQSQNADLRVLDLTRGTDTRFTFDPAHDQRPIWSPDGSRIVWASNREGIANLYQKAASGAGQDELLLRSDFTKAPLDWSADGRFIVYQENHAQTNADLWVLPLEGARQPWAWLATPFDERNSQFSPDGKWLAYQSNESGSNEIYVQAFAPGAPASGVKWQLSTKGGVNPTWRRDGRELYFVSPGNALMSVDVTLGAEVKAGTPRELLSFRGLRIASTGSLNAAADGQRFLFGVGAEETTSLPPFTVVLNWLPKRP